MKTIDEMTRKEFEALPWRESFSSKVEAAGIVILPTRKIHDSGYRCMDFVAVGRDNKAICRLSGCSDVIHIDGIGGWGADWLNRYGSVPSLIPPSGWSIDCLRVSGLLRMWPSSSRVDCGDALSSFELYALPAEEKVGNDSARVGEAKI
jgi:hypothetical protein